jgi:hypothetical protein
MKTNKVKCQYTKEGIKMFNKGDIVQMVKENEYLEPMVVGNKYVVQDKKYGVATLFSIEDEQYYNVSIEILEQYFEQYEEPKLEECCNECCDCDECCERDENYEHLLDIMDNAEYTAFKVFDRCVVVACKLPNGFIIVESSACVDPDDYDVNYAIENCIDRIENKVRTMEAYRRCDEMSWFEEDYEDEDNCTNNDIDCVDCYDENCPYCTNNDH